VVAGAHPAPGVHGEEGQASQAAGLVALDKAGGQAVAQLDGRAAGSQGHYPLHRGPQLVVARRQAAAPQVAVKDHAFGPRLPGQVQHLVHQVPVVGGDDTAKAGGQARANGQAQPHQGLGEGAGRVGEGLVTGGVGAVEGDEKTLKAGYSL